MFKKLISKISSIRSDTVAISMLSFSLILAVFALFSKLSRTLTEQSYATSVVKILNSDQTGGGTGWSTTTLTGKNILITNNHVCNVSTTGYVIVSQGEGKKSIKRIISRSFERDLCAVEGVDAPSLTLAEKSPTQFQPIRVMGHPLLKPVSPSSGVYVGDIIAPIGFGTDEEGECPNSTEKVDGFFGSFCILQMELSTTTVPIYPGNSGSPVVNASGEVVGVMNAADSRSNQGLFIPLPYVREFINGVQ